jgi:transcription elongation factor Elf1
MIYIDSKYIGLISARLEKFSRVKDHLYNFRCPYCGDSKKNRTKKRGYLYRQKTDYNFKCHNCGASKSFTYFLKDLDKGLYDQYVMERYKEGLTGRGSVTPEPTFEFKKPVFKVSVKLPKASSNDRASDYLKKRKLNPEHFYYAGKFKEYCNSIKETYPDTKNDHARIIIPFYDEDKKLIGFQGRSLDPWVTPKYLTVMLDEDHPKIYGLDTIDKEEVVYITEGPFDSTFIRNSVAMCGADLRSSDLGIRDICWIYDNEPRNNEITERISKCIKRGDKIVIWPDSVKQKDINDMILAGHNVQDIVESNTYKGLQAELKFNLWKKNDQQHYSSKAKRYSRST